MACEGERKGEPGRFLAVSRSASIFCSSEVGSPNCFWLWSNLRRRKRASNGRQGNTQRSCFWFFLLLPTDVVLCANRLSQLEHSRCAAMSAHDLADRTLSGLVILVHLLRRVDLGRVDSLPRGRVCLRVSRLCASFDHLREIERADVKTPPRARTDPHHVSRPAWHRAKIEEKKTPPATHARPTSPFFAVSKERRRRLSPPPFDDFDNNKMPLRGCAQPSALFSRVTTTCVPLQRPFATTTLCPRTRSSLCALSFVARERKNTYNAKRGSAGRGAAVFGAVERPHGALRVDAVVEPPLDTRPARHLREERGVFSLLLLLLLLLLF